jgi:hypothetical protein
MKERERCHSFALSWTLDTTQKNEVIGKKFNNIQQHNLLFIIIIISLLMFPLLGHRAFLKDYTHPMTDL